MEIYRLFSNKNLNTMTTTTKMRIYKACVKPVMTYAAEARAATVETKKMTCTNENRVLRTITGNTLRHRRRSSGIREEWQTEDIVKWIRANRRFWNEHVPRMGDNRPAKVV